MSQKLNQIDYVFPPEIRMKIIELLDEKDPQGKESGFFKKELQKITTLAQAEDDLELVNFWRCRDSVIRRPSLIRQLGADQAAERIYESGKLNFKNCFQHLVDSFADGIVSNAKNLEYNQTTKNGFIIYKAISEVISPNRNDQRFEIHSLPSWVIQRDGIYAQIGVVDDDNAKVLSYANGDSKSGRRLLEDFMDFIATLLGDFGCVFGSVADHANKNEKVYGGIASRFQTTQEGINKLAKTYRAIGGLLDTFKDKRPMIYFYADPQDGKDIFGEHSYEKMNPKFNLYKHAKSKKTNPKRPQILSRTKPRPVEKISEET